MTTAPKPPPPGKSPLLHSKLMPPRLHPNVIPRDDLLSRLDQGLTRKLIVVSAPTGFGKTTLVSSWLASRGAASAWVTIDQNDNDLTRFWTYVVSALRALDSSIGKTTLSILAAPQPASFHALLTPLINDLPRLPKESLLILDEFHFIKSREILEGVAFLIQHLPDTLHLLLIARTEPDLSLSLLRVRDDMIEIDAADLRFDQSETQAFLQRETQMELSDAEIGQLLQKTEGWVAGLRLIAVSLHNQAGSVDSKDLIRSLSSQNRYVSDYLIDEVFRSLPEFTQLFLLKTCFFGRLTASLCDSITDTSQSAMILEQLDRDNLFLMQLQRSDAQIWYRYNPMFAESIQFLARKRLGETEIQSLFEKASHWYDYHGLLEEAIETALTTNLFDRAIALIEKFIEIHDLMEMTTLGRWLEKIPDQAVMLHPRICFTYAQVILYSTDRFAPATAVYIEPYLRAAETRWQNTEDHEKLGQLLSFRGNVQWWQGDFQKAFHYAQRSLPELPEHDVFWRGNSLLIIGYQVLQAGQIRDAEDLILEARALLGAAQNIFGVLAAIQMLAEIFYWQGELEQAEQLNRQILTEAVGDESMLDDQGIASLGLARIAYERNDLEAAQQEVERALDLARQRANETLAVQATIQLASLLFAKGDLFPAREMLKSLETKTQNPGLLREIQNAQSLIAIRANDTKSLEWWSAMVSKEDPSVPGLQKERETFTLARIQIAEGRATEAIELLGNRYEDAVNNGRTRSRVEALCLQALAYSAAEKSGEASGKLEEALAIAQPQDLRRIFLDEGKGMAVLLRETLSKISDRTLRLFVSTLLHSFGRELPPSPSLADVPVLIEPLSPQELRVLRLLVAGLSNADIARELVVSANTIKTHVKNIYRKLSVNSREEARGAARELRLL